ncbi:MAG: hypothetical protein OXI30_11885 [Chloroflexota bacterium]|nr:hypothetical protein [Chloroflexota bacterium]
MKQLIEIAWDRFSVNSAIVADLNGRFIATAFYFTIMVPFGLLSAIFMDPLRRKMGAASWAQREPLPTDIASAREQG